MACLPIASPLPSLRRQFSYCPSFPVTSIIQLKNLRLQKLYIQAVSKKNASQHDLEDVPNEEGAGKASKKTQRAPRRSKKKTNVELPRENSVETISNLNKEEESTTATSAEDSKKVTRRGRKKAITVASSKEEVIEKKTTKRRTRKNIDLEKDKNMSGELSDLEESTSLTVLGNEMEELRLREDEGEDISFTYNWPPLVCCFGAAQHAFIPSGRPANRLIDHEIHESKKDMFWSPSKFVRAPGSSSSSVATALASIGGRVAFMGKLGDDEYGQTLLYHLNVNKVQTRATVMDTSRPTAVSQMKITRRGGLKSSCVKPCAEDSFMASEIIIDILKEVLELLWTLNHLLKISPTFRTRRPNWTDPVVEL